MLHKMKLKEEPFNDIINGTKTIEFRLFDAKRQQINIGDEIEFSKLPDLKDKMIVKVLDLYKDDSFENLFKNLFSDEDKVKSMTKMMLQFYSHEEEDKYGVVGIKIKLK